MCCLLTTLCAAFVTLCHSPGAAEDRWPEIIRDALIANKAQLDEGRASMTLDFRPDTSKEEVVTVQAEVTWRGQQMVSKIRVRDLKGTLNGTINWEPLESTPWESRLNDGKALYIFKPSTRTLFVHSATQDVSPMVELHPLRIWLKCCPPGQGRPFMDMVGTFPQIPGQVPPRFEFAQIDSRKIRELRYDPDGGVLEKVYDLEQSCNVVRLEYTAPGSGIKLSEGEFHWRKLGSASVLDRLDFLHRVPSRTSANVTERITLRVDNDDLHAIPPSHFTKSHFLKELPADTLIDDRVQQRRYPMNAEAKMREQDLRDLSDLIRKRGLLKK